MFYMIETSWRFRRRKETIRLLISRRMWHLLTCIYGQLLHKKQKNQKTLTTWKVSKYGVFSRPYFAAFGLNTDRYSVSLRIEWPEKTPYLDIFHAVSDYWHHSQHFFAQRLSQVLISRFIKTPGINFHYSPHQNVKHIIG